MAAATAKGLFTEHFVSPASATWIDLKNGAQNSITRADISGYLWNSLVCSTPLVAGGGAAYAINKYAHQHWVSKLPFESATSLIFTTISFIAGASVSFFVVRFLSAIGGTLSPFTADKALHLETLHIIVLGISNSYFSIFWSPTTAFLSSAPVFWCSSCFRLFWRAFFIYDWSTQRACFCSLCFDARI